MVVKTSLDTDVGSNMSVIYGRINKCIIAGVLGVVGIVTLNPVEMALTVVRFYIAFYSFALKKSNKIDDELRQKLIGEGIIHPYQMETLEYYQDEIDKVLDKYRESDNSTPKAKSKKERKKSQKKTNKSPQKTKKNKK